MTIREFIEAMRQRPFMDHKDIRIGLSADEWGTGDYADWRQLFVTMVRDTDVPNTIDDIKKELKVYRESIYKEIIK